MIDTEYLQERWNDIFNCNEFIKDASRATKDEYGCLIALTVASKSEDPHTIAGACILNSNGRVISTGYNGLTSGIKLPKILTREKYRDIKRSLFIHAETNALALIKKENGC